MAWQYLDLADYLLIAEAITGLKAEVLAEMPRATHDSYLYIEFGKRHRIRAHSSGPKVSGPTAAGVRMRKASGPASTCRPPTLSVDTFPPNRAVASSTISCGWSALGRCGAEPT